MSASTLGASTVGVLFAATAAAKPGMKPVWLIPGGRPINDPGFIELGIDGDLVSPPGMSIFALTLRLAVEVVLALSTEALLDLGAGVVGKCVVDIEGRGEFDVVDLRSA